MGAAKQMMEDRDAELGRVLAMLERAGAVEACENHGYKVDQGDPGAVEEVQGELSAEMDEADAADLIQNALSLVGEECPGCAKNARD